MRHVRSARTFGLVSAAIVALAAAPIARAQSVALPPPPELSQAGRELIYEFETGGRAGYNPRPEWPGYASGVTVGIGYDCGYNRAAVIERDWRLLGPGPSGLLAATAGVTGPRARPLARDLRAILVRWELASAVFDTVTVTRFYQLTSRTFPGLEELRPNAQAALVSLVFNRGSSLSGPRRTEMRAIVPLVRRQDYAGIARQLRIMIRHWKGSDIERGMTRRRLAEAALVETP